MALSRRDFIRLTGGAAAATLSGCTATDRPAGQRRGAPSAPAAGADDALSTFLRSLRQAARTSPDHLTARADAIVASRDPLAAVRFVRDEIAVVHADQPVTGGNWGPRAALRAGAGTLRERAEVLAGMLAAMGTTARLVEIDRPPGLTAAALWRARPHAFAPDKAALQPLLDQAGLPPLAPAAAGVDARARQTIDGIAGTLLARMPAAARRATKFAPRDVPERIPAVEYTAQGRRVIAIAAGELDVREGTGETRDAGTMVLPTVEVAVAVALNPPVGSGLDASRTHELLRAAWPADQAAGRRLTLTFPVPGQSLRTRPGAEAGPTRLPLLRLSDARPIPESVTTMVGGSLLSLSGAVFQRDPAQAGRMVGPFGQLALRPAAARATLARSVTSLRAEAGAATFPDIDLRVAAVDAAGKPVDGLAAADFVVTEDGRAQQAHLLADNVPALPRVLVVYDGSMSASGTFRTPDGKRAFDRHVAEALVAAAAETPFATQLIGIGGAAAESGWAPPDAAGLVAAMPSATTSDLWGTLGEAVPASGAAVVVLVSDNDATDAAEAVPRLRARLAASGIPIISLPVGTPRPELTAAIVSASRGEAVNPADPALPRVLAGAVRRRLTATPPYGYRLRYRTDRPAPGGGPRQVVVALADRRKVAATASYTVPAEGDRLVPPGLAGVYLTLTVNGVTDTRRLGGVEVSYRGTPDLARLDARTLAEATNAVLGITTVAFEPPDASAGELLDDTIGALLELDPIVAAIPQGEAAIAAQLRHLQRIPAVFAPLLEPVGDGHPGAVATGLRTAILIESHGLADGVTDGAARTVVDTLDVVPAHGHMLGLGDPEAAFRAAMTASLTPSYREMTLSPASAAARLTGRPLTYLAPNAAYPSARPRQQVLLDRYAGMHRFVASDGSVEAIWIVDPTTGTAIAIDEAGRGGAVRSQVGTNCDSGNLADLLDFASLLISTACTFADYAKGTTAYLWCVGANVEGVVTLGVGSFTDPVSVGGVQWWASAAGAGMGLKSAWDAAHGAAPSGMARRIVETFLSLMSYAVGSAKQCGPAEGPPLPPRAP